MPRSTLFRVVRRVASGVVAVAAIFLTLTPMGCYISRAAWEEARILSRRTPIPKLIEDPATDVATRDKLSLVLEARRFAIDSLGLKAGKSFETYSRLDRDTLVLVVSAAYRDRLERKTWWFPVVGRFPYKGFFNFDAALKTAEQLRAEGFAVTVGASSAFSTLGWFNDPLVTTTLRQDSVTLVNTVIHELLHNTWFAKGDVSFNESLATFVGGRGAEQFFGVRGDSAGLKRARDDWHDDLLLGAFWERLATEIDSVFAALPPDSTALRIAAADSVYMRARIRLTDTVGVALRTYPAWWPARVPLDNAVLMSRRVYAQDLHVFDSVYIATGQDMKAAIKEITSKRSESTATK